MNRVAAIIAAALVFGCDPYGGQGISSVDGPADNAGNGGGPERPQTTSDRGGTGGTGGNGAEGGDTGLPGTATGALLYADQPDGSLTVYRVNDDGTLSELGNFR